MLFHNKSIKPVPQEYATGTNNYFAVSFQGKGIGKGGRKTNPDEVVVILVGIEKSIK